MTNIQHTAVKKLKLLSLVCPHAASHSYS